MVVTVLRVVVNAQEMVVHYLTALLVSQMMSQVPELLPVHTTVPVIAGFTIVDQLLCALVYYKHGKRLARPRLFTHIVYGFANSKTYYIVCFLMIQGTSVDLVRLCMSGALSWIFIECGGLTLTQRLLNIPAFPLLFYQQHRIGHLPGVYQCAHKLHHYLHDSTPFDAHVYGEGMAEQYGWLAVEVIMCCYFGLPPYILNIAVLHATVTNKFAHCRYDLSLIHISEPTRPY
eukprot:TRINITY_DN3712_c0_g1_i1.p1 TRINITY_DN3712_c0_g1~~TRINITY_DN3712_c0_g1_i1.p1  ORF type:complete len:231 (+),score=48.76 TRINITY_DN3712_c0_g1_i1:1-693(+)